MTAAAAMLDVNTLDDATKWNRVSGVPVFFSHEREFPEQRNSDGTVTPAFTVKVTDNDLPEIARQANATAAAYGGVLPLMVGHRKFDPNFPEQNQPPLVGFGKNYRVERVAYNGESRLAVVEDEYVPLDKSGVYRQYPYRSLEYNPATKASEGVAMLIRPPWLKMGTTYLYQADGGRTVADETKKPDDDTFTPDEEKAYAKMCRYMAKKHPRLAQYMDAMGPANGDAPAPVPPPPPAPYANPAQLAVYAADLAAVKSQLDAERAARIDAECRSLLNPIKPFRQFDYDRELGRLKLYQTDAERAGHLKYIVDNYAHLPTGGMIPVYAGTAHLPTPEEAVPEVFKAPPKHDEVMSYMRSNPGMTYEAAKSTIIAAGAK